MGGESWELECWGERGGFEIGVEEWEKEVLRWAEGGRELWKGQIWERRVDLAAEKERFGGERGEIWQRKRKDLGVEEGRFGNGGWIWELQGVDL